MVGPGRTGRVMEEANDEGMWVTKQARAYSAAIEQGPGWGVAQLVAFGLVSVVLLQVAVNTEEAFAFLGWSIGGAAVGLIALGGIGPAIRGPDQQSDEARERRRAKWRRIAWSLAVAGIGLMVIGALVLTSPFLATLGIAVAVAGHVILTDAWARSGTERPWLWTIVGIIGLAWGVILALAVDGMGLVFGVAIAVFGLSSTKVGVGALISRDEQRVSRPTQDAAAVLLVGLAASLLGPLLAGMVRTRPSVIVGATAAVAGLSLVGIGATALIHRRLGAAVRIAITVTGSATAGAGLWVGWGTFKGWTAPALLMFALAFVVGAFYVFRGEAVMLMVLFGALLAWVLVDRTTSAPTDQNEAGLIVAFGDSFTAGEGATEFLAHTNSLADDANTCRRSPNSYPFALGEALGYRVVSYACSGAKIDEVVLDGKGQKDDSKTMVSQNGGEVISDAKVAGKKTQLRSVDDDNYGLGADDDDVDIVVMSIGGNDADFAEVVSSCVLPSDCTTRDDDFLAQASGIEANLTEVYTQVAERFESARLIVVPYPPYVGPRGCDGALSDHEAGFANTFIQTLNHSAQQAVAAANGDLRPEGDVAPDDPIRERIVLFDGLDRAFATKTLCDDNRGANFVQFLPRAGPVWERLNPGTWHFGTGHPNDLGYACIGEALAGFVSLHGIATIAPDRSTPDCIIGTVDDARTLTGGINEAVAGYQRNRIVDEPAANFDAEAYLTDEVERLVPPVATSLGLSLVGGLLFALGIVTRLRGLALGLVPLWLRPTTRSSSAGG